MNDRDFVYWLQGFFEMTEAEELTKEQVQMIKDHLKLVFKKETPSLPYNPKVKKQPYIGDDTRLHKYIPYWDEERWTKSPTCGDPNENKPYCTSLSEIANLPIGT